MAETTTTPKEAAAKEAAKEREQAAKATDAPPTPEATMALNAPNSAYYDPPGNWSDPPELAEGENEVEGSLAKPLEEDAEKEREKVRKDEKERIAKAIEENDKKAEPRRKWEEEQARKRAGTA